MADLSKSSSDVPPLAEFLRWAAELPAEFRGEADGKIAVPVRAVVHDIYESHCGERPLDEFLIAFAPKNARKSDRNWLKWALAACHILWHPVLRAAAVPADRLRALFFEDLPALAAVVPAENLLNDEERREELVRLVFAAARLRPPGETAAIFKDRLTQIDSVEHQRVIAAAATREKRSREVRDEMARKAAEEAAAKVSRE